MNNKKQGFITVLSLLILLILTLISLTAHNKCIIQVDIVHNEYAKLKADYQAEAIVNEVAQILSSSSNDDLSADLTDPSRTLDWLHEDGVISDPTALTAWDNSIIKSGTSENGQYIAFTIQTHSFGESVDMNSDEKVMKFRIFAKSKNKANSIIEIGYKRRVR